MIKFYLVFALSVVLSGAFLLFSSRILKWRVERAAVASYFLAYLIAWTIGSPWWSIFIGALVGLLYGQYASQWIDCRPFAGTVKPVRWIMPAAHLLTALWAVVGFIGLYSGLFSSMAKLNTIESETAKIFAGHGDAASFVVKYYLPCMKETATISHGGGKSARTEVVKNTALNCTSQAVTVATAEKGSEFAREVSVAILEWDKIVSEQSEQRMKIMDSAIQFPGSRE